MRYGLLCMTALMVALTRPALAQGSFTPLGAENTYVSGMSADGRVIVGIYGSEGPAWRWTAETGVVNLGSASQHVAVSRDGRTVVGKAKGPDGIVSAAIWQNAQQWLTLPPPDNARVQDNEISTAYHASADGSVIVGLAWVKPSGAQAFRYDAKTGKTVTLGSLKGESTRANYISADGNVIVGWDEVDGEGPWLGVIWWQDLERLMHPFEFIGQVEATNNVGSIMVGRGHPMNRTHAYRYTAWDGHVEDLGAVNRDNSGTGIGGGPADDIEDTSLATGVSDDGNVVVGLSGYKPPTDAFIWTPATKIMKLGDYLTSKGITGHERWTLISAHDVSPDGKIIAGTGINNARNRVEGYVVRLP